MEFQLNNENLLKSVTRLKKIEFTNFRNIGKGSISFPNTECEDVLNGSPSILGLYGQNGSGKTSVIMSLGILKRLLIGQAISKGYASCIRKGYDRCSLSFTFGQYLCADIDNEEAQAQAQQTEIFYSFDLVDTPDPVLSANVKNIPTDRLFVENEIIQLRYYLPDGTILMPKQVLIDTSIKNSNKKGYAFGNATKYSQYVGDSVEVKKQLLLLKKKKYVNGRSFVFSKDLLGYITTDAFFENYEEGIALTKKVFDFFSCAVTDEENPMSSMQPLLELFGGKSDPEFMAKLKRVFSEDDSIEISDEDEDELWVSLINHVMSLIIEEDNWLCKLDSSHKKWPLARMYSIDEIDDDSSEADAAVDAMLDELTKRYEKINAFFQRNTCSSLLSSLSFYGWSCLHIVDTAITGQTNMNTTLPLLLWGYVREGDSFRVHSECIDLNMDNKTGVPVEKYSLVERSVSAINTVLTELIPDIQLSFEDLGVAPDEEGAEKHFFEIQSIRNDTRIPLKYESDGVRRIVSLTSLFIAVYNEPSFTMAIDEIDSGIFEYLLGELFQVMVESAQGQFIFTSHNLRPLEVLPAKYLCFTSTNPDRRFVKLRNRGNCNLRDTYIRMIVLGSKDEEVYKSTDRYLLSRALFKAGHIGGTE